MLIGMLRRERRLVERAAGHRGGAVADEVLRSGRRGAWRAHTTPLRPLQERQSWVENLSRDFGWLRDGRILCAALLQKDEDAAERDRGLNLLFGHEGSAGLHRRAVAGARTPPAVAGRCPR